MKKIDVSALWGNWPFRFLAHSKISDLQAMHMKYDIQSGYVASLESIFYNDPMESEEKLAAELKGTNYRQVVTVNPALSAFDEMIDEAVDRFAIAAVKIVPGYHGYSLNDACMKSLYLTLKKHHLPLYLTRRIEDVRLNYLFQPRDLYNEEILSFAQSFCDIPLLMCGFSCGEVLQFSSLANDLPNVYYETSLFKGDVGWMAEAMKILPHDRILFGSSYPFYVMGTQVMEIQENGLSYELQQKLFAKNAEHFFTVR